jgi:MFS family permease
MTTRATKITSAITATRVAFLVNGLLLGSILPRLVEINRLLDLTVKQYGIIAVSFTIGATAVFQLPATLIRRFGSQAVAVLGAWFIAVAFIGAGFAAQFQLTPWWWMAICLAAAGFGDGIVDVAHNAQGIRVQNLVGRSLINSMHAGWSLGVAGGGAIGVLVAVLGIPIGWHLSASGLVCAGLVTTASLNFLPDQREPSPNPPEATSRGWPLASVVTFVGLLLVALVTTAIEDVGNNWTSLFINTQHNWAPQTAGIGVPVVIGMQFVGRAVGDQLLDRLGTNRALGCSLGCVGLGLSFGVTWPNSWCLAGFALAGFGAAIPLPVAFALADKLPGLRAQTGVTMMAWGVRVCTIGVSPCIALVTDISSLQIGLTVPIAIAIAAGGATWCILRHSSPSLVMRALPPQLTCAIDLRD